MADDYTLLHQLDFHKSYQSSETEIPSMYSKQELSFAYCKKNGHVISECLILNRKQERTFSFIMPLQ